MRSKEVTEAYFSTAVSLEQMAGAPKPGYDPFDFYSRKGYLYAHRNPDTAKQYFVFSYLNYPLKKDSLAEGLAVSTPKFNPKMKRQDVEGIRNDWNLLEKKSPNPEIQEQFDHLRGLHRELFDPDWTVWNAYSRLPFMRALESRSLKELDGFMKGKVDRMVDEAHFRERPTEYLLGSRSAAIWFWQTLRAGRTSFHGGYYPISDWLSGREEPLTADDLYSKSKNRPKAGVLIPEMPVEMTQALFKEYIEDYSYISVDSEARLGLAYESPSWRDELKIYNVGNKRINLDLEGGWGLAEFNLQGQAKLLAQDWSSYKYKDAALSPTIVLEFNEQTGEFNYLFDKIPTGLVGGKNAEARARLGLSMLVPYVDNERRDSKPRRVKVIYRGREYRQTINAAQTILFWPHERRHLVVGNLPKAIKSFVDGQSAA